MQLAIADVGHGALSLPLQQGAPQLAWQPAAVPALGAWQHAAPAAGGVRAASVLAGAARPGAGRPEQFHDIIGDATPASGRSAVLSSSAAVQPRGGSVTSGGAQRRGSDGASPVDEGAGGGLTGAATVVSERACSPRTADSSGALAAQLAQAQQAAAAAEARAAAAERAAEARVAEADRLRERAAAEGQAAAARALEAERRQAEVQRALQVPALVPERTTAASHPVPRMVVSTRKWSGSKRSSARRTQSSKRAERRCDLPPRRSPHPRRPRLTLAELLQATVRQLRTYIGSAALAAAAPAQGSAALVPATARPEAAARRDAAVQAPLARTAAAAPRDDPLLRARTEAAEQVLALQEQLMAAAAAAAGAGGVAGADAALSSTRPPQPVVPLLASHMLI